MYLAVKLLVCFFPSVINIVILISGPWSGELAQVEPGGEHVVAVEQGTGLGW